MLVDEFRQYLGWLHSMTTDFVDAVPDSKWEFTPDPRSKFGSFSRQLRHVVRVRGVYNDALIQKRVDWTRSRDQYDGPLTREALLVALNEQQARVLDTLEAVDPDVRLDWGRNYYTFPTFTREFLQHEAIHNGQWTLYAFLAEFETPDSWRESWKLERG